MEPHLSLNTNENYQIFDNKPEFFVGNEVEGTKFQGKKTLFVRGDINHLQIIEKLKELDGIQHLFIGHSKTYVDPMNFYFICHYLLKDYYITLEVDQHKINVILDDTPGRFINFKNFRHHPNLCLLYPVMATEDLYDNIYIKLEPVNTFKEGSGVYVMNTTDCKFTPWEDYKKDEVV